MANNYVFPGQTQPASYPVGNTNTQPMNTNPTQQLLQVIPISTREAVEQFPMAPNSTIVFMNYNARKLWIRSQHYNGLSYDIEDFNMLTNQDLQNFQAQAQNQVQGQQNQNGSADYVTREEFDKLKASFEELMK